MKVAIVQPSYIPWRGVFDLVNSVDHFVLLEDVQYTRCDWRNRNRIKTPQGMSWLTIPVNAAGNFGQLIKDVTVFDGNWAEKHWKTLLHNYSKAPMFREYRDRLEAAYQRASTLEFLSEVNLLFMQEICSVLGITTLIHRSRDFEMIPGKNERLIHVCTQLGATEYVSGPKATCYLETEKFEQHGLKLSIFEYGPYPEYEQLYPPFEHQVTVLDLILHKGDEAKEYITGYRNPSNSITAAIT